MGCKSLARFGRNFDKYWIIPQNPFTPCISVGAGMLRIASTLDLSVCTPSLVIR